MKKILYIGLAMLGVAFVCSAAKAPNILIILALLLPSSSLLRKSRRTGTPVVDTKKFAMASTIHLASTGPLELGMQGRRP